MGKTCVFPDPDWNKLLAFKPQKMISVVPVKDDEWEWQRGREMGFYNQGPRCMSMRASFDDQERCTEEDKANKRCPAAG